MAPVLVPLASVSILLGVVLGVLLGGLAIAVAIAMFAGEAVRKFRNYLRVLWDHYRIRGRWLEFVPPAVVFPGLIAILIVMSPEVPTERGLFLGEYSSFFQTSAQVLAALLIAMAVEVKAPKSVEDTVAVRPANKLMVFLLALAELAAMSALTPFLPSFLFRLELYLTIAGGAAALLAVALINRRILVD